MKERYTGGADNKKFTRIIPEAGQSRTRGGASGRKNRWQNTRESANPFANKREQTGSARENIHNLYTARQEWLQSMRGGGRGTLEEIRDILRRQEIRRELEERAAFSARLDEKLFGKRQEAVRRKRGRND